MRLADPAGERRGASDWPTRHRTLQSVGLFPKGKAG